jgi:hypothetical protein
MMHAQISRNFAKAFFAFATLVMAAACADTNVAPTTAAVAFKAPAGFDVMVGVETFTVSNTDGIVERLGEHVISIPAGAICDPFLSTYGSTEWNKPCTPLRGSITITATMMRDNNNRPYVDFQPALRFAPDKEVMLFLRNGRAPSPTKLFTIYCNNLGYCIDESVNDPSLKPFRVGRTSLIGRRVKHFSGYTVGYGVPCNGTLTEEPDGSWMCNDDGLTRRSGYMVASGLTTNGDKKEAIDEEKSGKKAEQ